MSSGRSSSGSGSDSSSSSNLSTPPTNKKSNTNNNTPSPSRKRNYSTTPSIYNNNDINSMDLTSFPSDPTYHENDTNTKKRRSHHHTRPSNNNDLYTTTTTHHHRHIITDQSRTTTTITNIPSRTPSQRNVPAFLHKLFNMVEDPATVQLIRWSKSGNSFLVEGHEEFAKSVLPRFYKHNTFASFVRQLNMYDFHKIPHIQQGVLVNSNVENEVWEFSNPNFRRDRPDLLVLVTRKRNRDRDDTPDASAGGVNLNSLVKEISAIKQHQTNITADLKNLHRDNEIIWKETIIAREKHQKHQLVISKILQFLTAVFSNEQHQLEGVCQDMLQQQEPPQFSQLQPGGYDSSSSNNVSDESDTCQIDFAKASIHNSGNPDAFEHDDSTNLDTNPPCATMAIDKSDPIKTPVAAPIHFGIPSNKIDKGKMLYDPTGIISRSAAQSITHDIDELQGNVETLAAQLGIDPTQFPLDNEANSHLSSDNYSSMITNATENDKLRLFELATTSSTTTTSSHTRPKLQHQYHTTENIRVSAHYSSSSTSFLSPHSERYHDPNVFKQFLSSVNQYNNDNLEEPPTLQHVNKTPIYQSNSIPNITSNTITKDANVKKEKEENVLTNVEARRLFLSSLLANQQLQEQKYANLQHQQRENANFVDTAPAPNATFTQPPYIRSNHSFPTLHHHHTSTPFSTHYQPPTMPSSTITTTTTTTTALPSNPSTNFNNNNDLHHSFNNVHQLEQHISLMNSTNNTNSDADYSQQMVEASNFMNQNESKKEDRTIAY